MLTYHPLTNDARLLIRNLLSKRAQETADEPDGQSHRLASDTLVHLIDAVDVVVVNDPSGPRSVRL